jgi:hypothetical protein
MKEREAALKFWQTGDASAEWIEIIASDKECVLPRNMDPLPAGGVQKRPPIIRQNAKL